MRSLHHWLFLGVACLTVILTSCTGDPITAAEGAERKIFLINTKSEPRFLDLQRCNSVSEHNIMLAMFEGLVAESPDSDKDVEPAAATSWESNADKSVWTFHLRKNAVWSDGRPITASDWVWSWQRMLNKNLAAEYSVMLFLLKNGREVYRQEAAPDQLGVKALDPHTLEVTLVGPTPHFLLMLCHASWWVVPQHVIEKWGGVTDMMNKWTDAGHMTGNGPFKLKRYLFRQYVEVERNPLYWDAANVKLEGVRFYAIDSDTAEDRLFRRGQLHVTYSVPLSRVPVYSKQFPALFLNYNNLAVRFFRVNTTRGVLKDPRVRRALGLAVERDSIVNNILRSGQRPAFGITPPMDGYPGVQEFSFNPEEARRLLKEAGFPGGKGFPSDLNILIARSETDTQIAEAVQAMWEKHLGVKIGITQQDFQIYLTTQHNMHYDIAVAGWNADYYDPATFVDMWGTDAGNNETGWSDKEFDALIDSATKCPDAVKRFGMLLEAESRLLKAAPVVPIYFYTRSRLIHPAVKNWKPRLLDNALWKHLDLTSPSPPFSMELPDP